MLRTGGHGTGPFQNMAGWAELQALKPSARRKRLRDAGATEAEIEEACDEIIKELKKFKKKHANESPEAIARLKEVALSGGNIMEELMHSVKVCSLGEITEALFECGGKFRRNM